MSSISDRVSKNIGHALFTFFDFDLSFISIPQSVQSVTVGIGLTAKLTELKK